RHAAPPALYTLSLHDALPILPARTVIRAEGTTTEVLRDGQVIETNQGDPLAFIEQYQGRFKVAVRPGMPRFCGGLAGYFGYDTVDRKSTRLNSSHVKISYAVF